MATSGQYASNDSYDLIATIADGQTTSGVIDLGGVDVCGFFFPASMTGATMKIQACATPDGTYVLVQKDEIGGGDYTITVTSSKFVPITNLAIVAGLRFVKLVSGSAESGAKAITLACRPI